MYTWLIKAVVGRESHDEFIPAYPVELTVSGADMYRFGLAEDEANKQLALEAEQVDEDRGWWRIESIERGTYTPE